MKQLSCLSPKKVPIQIPQVNLSWIIFTCLLLWLAERTYCCLNLIGREGLLHWKQQLDRNVDTRKLEANICSIHLVSPSLLIKPPYISYFLLFLVL